MIDRRTLGWRIAKALAGHAARTLAPERHDWSRAMLNELDHLPDAGTAIRWALGCLFAGYIDRIHTMYRSLKNVSPLILSLEMLLCFVPVTWLCVTVLSSAMHGSWSPTDALLYASATLVGPVGLVIAIRTALLKQPGGGMGNVALCVLAAWTFVAYSGLIIRNEGGLSTDGWRSFVLIALLPALATAHLTYMAHETRGRSAAVAA
jgi:hypothetical protein